MFNCSCTSIWYAKMIFEKLPDITRCCCFLPLKAGTVFIALIFMILSAANNKLHLKDVEGYECYSGVLGASCPLNQEMEYVTDATIFVAFMYFLPSAFLIVGVLKNIRNIVTTFLYFVSMSIIIAEIIDWTVLIIGLVHPPCGTTDEIRIKCAIGDTIFLIVSVYFLIVVKSFRKTMLVTNPRRSRISLQTTHKSDKKIHVLVTDTQGALKKKSSLINTFTSGGRTSAFRNTSSKSSSDDYIPRPSRPRLKSSESSSRASGPRDITLERRRSSFEMTTSSSDGRYKSSAAYSSIDTS